MENGPQQASGKDSDLPEKSTAVPHGDDGKLKHLGNTHFASATTARGGGGSSLLSKLKAGLSTTPSNGGTSNSVNSGSSGFWKSTRKVPGTIRVVPQKGGDQHITRVVGAQYPPPATREDTLVSHSGKTPRSSMELKRASGSGAVGEEQLNGNGALEDTSSSSGSSPLWLRDSSERGSGSVSPHLSRVSRFNRLLQADNIDLEALRKLSWQGVPSVVRAVTWKLLLGYLPTNKDRQPATIQRKQKEYRDCIPKYFDIEDSERTTDEKALYRQIQVDVPRTKPDMDLFQNPIVQQCLARILYIWAIRHPASGYVQGINDLATPFFVVFLQDTIGENLKSEDVDTLQKDVLTIIEADTYWCMTKLLDGIQDNYTFSQPGIQRMVHKLSDLIHRLDAPLHEHLKQQDVMFMQFSFRWMNCLLMREISLELVIRIWDSYFAELETFSVFHIYACAAFLCKFSNDLKQREFQEIMLFLRTPPTQQWTDGDIEMLLSQAYIWFTLFDNAPKHLTIEE